MVSVFGPFGDRSENIFLQRGKGVPIECGAFEEFFRYFRDARNSSVDGGMFLLTQGQGARWTSASAMRRRYAGTVERASMGRERIFSVGRSFEAS